MTRYRNALPQCAGKLFLTDGGIETCLIFHDGLDLPLFAAFTQLADPKGRSILDAYFRRYADIARERKLGFIFESATWRASPDWAEQLGYSRADLAAANRAAIDMVSALRDELETPDSPMVISGCVGPRGDGYIAEKLMTPDQAAAYHGDQIGTFAATDADMITAITMTYANEAIGIARAAEKHGMPVALAFTVETDGRLPDGQPLGEAIEQVDAATGSAPAYYMINCAHPTHFDDTVSGGAWTTRIGGIRANASRMSHAELDEAEELDDGNPDELAGQYRALRARLAHLNVLGGCCGTDHRHVAAIAAACSG